MPAASRGFKPSGVGGCGWLIWAVVVVVILGGACAGFYFWSRVSATASAEQFVAAFTERFTSGEPDFETLKKVVVKDSVDEIEQMEQFLGGLGGAQGPGAMAGSVNCSYEVKDVSVGFSETTVNVTTKVEFGGMSRSQDMKVVLVREGLAWKVDLEKMGQSFGDSMGPG